MCDAHEDGTSAADAEIRSLFKAEGSVDGSWGRPCESRTSLGKVKNS